MGLAKPYRVSDLRRAAQGLLPVPPCDETIGVTVTRLDSKAAHAVWTAGDPLLNGHGVIMGGFISAATDVVMAYAMATCLEDRQTFSSITLQTTYHRPARAGTLDIIAKVERLGRTTAYLTAEVHQEGRHVATSVSSMLIREENDATDKRIP